MLTLGLELTIHLDVMGGVYCFDELGYLAKSAIYPRDNEFERITFGHQIG